MQFCYPLLFLLLFSVGVKAQNQLPELIPDSSTFPAFKTLNTPTVYVGDDLFTMIDGGAEIYFEYGFYAALSASYLYQDSVRIELQLYQMSDVGAAYGTLTNVKLKNDSVIFNPPVQIIWHNDYLQFQKGIYYGVLSWSDNPEGLKPLIENFMQATLKNIKVVDTYPELVQKALSAGYAPGSIKYIRGTIALSGSHFFSHKDVFGVSEALAIDLDETQYFLFSYPDAEAMNKQFTLLAEDLQSNTRIENLTQEETTIQYTDRRGRIIIIRKEGENLFVSVSPAGTEKGNIRDSLGI